MDEKWLKAAYQFEAEPSGGGGEPEGGSGDEPSSEGAAVRDADSEHVSHPLETREDEDSIPAGSDLGSDGAGDAPAVGVPDDLSALFAPPSAPQQPTATPASPTVPPAPVADQPGPEGPTPPPQVDFPTGDEWFEDAAKAAEKQRQAIEWSNWQSQEPLRKAIQDIQGDVGARREADFNAKVYEVNQAIANAEQTVAKFYAEDGPLNSDPEFRNNPQLQEAVNTVIHGCASRAVAIADQTGDTGPLNRMIQDPKFVARVLGMVKADVKGEDPGFKPGESPVGKQPGVPSKADGLTPEQRKALAAAKADGRHYTAADIKKALATVNELVY